MNAFGQRVRELRNAKGYSLRELAPLVDVGFSYLSKVERGRLDFGNSPSESLIHRLAAVLEVDEDELLLMAGRIPASITNRILHQPDVFRRLAKCDDQQLERLAKQARPSS